MSGDNAQPIIVKRIKKHAHGHHGGAWKVAYADFVTAMMAFFLMMWLVGSTTKEQKAALSEYFSAPSEVQGSSPQPTQHPTPVQGPGGASTSMIQFGGSLNLETERAKPVDAEPGKAKTVKENDGKDGKGKAVDAKTVEQVAREQEQQRLEQLQEQLHAAIQASQALAPYKDQLLIDITPEGLRIQIIDEENRPMFDSGSMHLKDYSLGILTEIAQIINKVPNKISISGHTDATPFSGRPDYSNWELSSDRANAARRALVLGGLLEERVARVVGLSSAVPFFKHDPFASSNRRISIIVMKRDLEESLGEAPAPETAPAVPVEEVAPSAPVEAAPAVDDGFIR